MKRLSNGRIVHGDPTPPAAGEQTPPAVTEARVTELVTGVVTNAFKDFQTKQVPGLFKGVNEQLASITESLKTLSESAPKKDEKPPVGDVETNTVIQGLRKQLETVTNTQVAEKKLREAAELSAQNTQKESRIRTYLDQFEFVTPDAKEDAFALIFPLITRDADGNLVGGDLTAEAFVKDFIPSKKSHLLMPVNTKGGDPAPGPRHSTSNVKVGIESIKPGMSQQELSAVAAQIRLATSEQRS